MPTVKQNAVPDANAKMEAFILARAINNAPAWMPNDNPDQTILHGTVVALSLGIDKERESEYPKVTYKLDSPCGKHEAGSYMTVHAFYTLLRKQLAECGTKIGSEQILSYDGKKKKNNPTQDEIDRKMDEYHQTFVQNVGEEVKAVAENFAF